MDYRIAAFSALIILSCSCSHFSGDAFPNPVTSESCLQAGVLNVRFSEQTASAIELSLAKSSGSETGICELDAALEGLGAERIERVFPYDEKYEERQRREGLHLYYRVKYNPKAAAVSKASDELSSVRGVESVSAPHRKRMAAVPFDDPLANKQWQYFNDASLSNLFIRDADIDVVRVWEKFTAGSKNVTVAVVDGGIDMSHPDLSEVCIPYGEDGSMDFVNGKSIVPDKHGTHVAGIIGAINNNGKYVCGVAGGNDGTGGVRLLSCQVFVGDEFGDSPAAIVWACNHGALVCNNSWGYDYKSQTAVNMSDIDEVDKKAIDYFIRYAGCDNDGNQLPDSPMKGGVVVFAAGNEKFYDAYPAAYAPVISVAALAPNNRMAYYSNFGKTVDICAPGGDFNVVLGNESAILSTTPVDEKYAGEGKAYTCYLQGTSMSCPMVSGVAALLVSYFGGEGFTADMLIEKLIGGANPAVTANFEKAIGPALDAYGSFVYGTDYLDSNFPYGTMTSGNNLTVYLELTEEFDGCHFAVSKDKELFDNLDWDAIVNGDNFSVPEQVLLLSYKGKPGDIAVMEAKLDAHSQYHLCGVISDRNRHCKVSRIMTFETQGNNPPVVSGNATAVIDSLGKTVKLALKDYIIDPDNDELVYEAKIANGKIAEMAISGDSLAITTLAYGRTQITLGAKDPSEESAKCSFLLVSRDGKQGTDLYPMPFSDILNVATAIEGSHTYRILSSKGTIASGSIVSSLDDPAPLELSFLPPGTYTLVLDDDSNNSYQIVKI